MEEKRVAAARAKLPSPEGALNLHDISVSILSIYQAVITLRELIKLYVLIFHMQKFAEQVLTSTAWACYRSAGDDNYSTLVNLGERLGFTLKSNACSFP